MNRRKQELSVMNVVFCIAVIIIHIISYPVSAFEPGTFKFMLFMFPSRMLSFVVQGFVFLSGLKLFLGGKDKMKYGDYLKYRFGTVLGHYIFCTAVYCISLSIFYNYEITLGYYVSGIVFGTVASHFYFITLLVQFDLLLPLWRRIVNKYSPIITVPVFVLLSDYFENSMQNIVNLFSENTVIYNDRIFTTYLSFWIIGCYAGKNYQQFCETVKKNFRFIATFFAVMSVLALVANYTTYNEIVNFPAMNTVHYGYALSAIFFVFSLALKIPEGKCEKIPLFRFIDSNSYLIYLWHLLVIFVSDLFIQKLGLAMQSLALIFRLLFVFPVTFFGVFVLSKIMEKLLPKKVSSAKQKQSRKLTFRVKYK